MVINYNPFPAVRVNGKFGRFAPRAKAYHEKMNELRAEIGDKKLKVIARLLDGNYTLVFMMPMPKSWSKKKKIEMCLKPHTQKPDIDNLFKAFTDTVFYDTNFDDSGIFKINCAKYWAEEGGISI